MSTSPAALSALRPPYSGALSTLSERTQPCITFNVPMYTQGCTRDSPESLQCARCFVLVLLCVERGDTAARVSSPRVRGVGVIGPDHKETSPLLPSLSHLGTMQWSDSTVTKSSMSFSSRPADYNNQVHGGSR